MMNPPKCDDLDYIQFLIAAQKSFTCTEAARCHPEGGAKPAHDAFTRLLRRKTGSSDTEALWREVEPLVELDEGVLVLDDTTLDKPYAEKMELVTWHWSGKHHRVVKGINLITLLWTDGSGDAHIPVDFRVYARHLDGNTKNDHARDLWVEAKRRGFNPKWVVFDSWYSSLENLKQLRRLGWRWLTQLKSNRLVNPNPDGKRKRDGYRQISTLRIPDKGLKVRLRGYGWVKVFKIQRKRKGRRTAKNGGAETDYDYDYWATNDLDLDREVYEEYSGVFWRIEEYHRGLKQCCGVERSQVRSALGQVRHIGLAIRAFIRLELHRLRTGLSWYKAKKGIIQDAIRSYLANPKFTLTPTA